jgi:anaerobic selenocysteine-containing dehydrogenase
VVIDLFMTDTARHADLVLPCTSVLEEEDIIHSSMFSPYVNHSGRAVLPPDF